MMRSLALLAVSSLAASAGSAQRPGALRPANATLAAEFSELTSLHELPDGRVLVSDRIENRVFVASFVTNRVREVGRIGDGPREYRNALPLFSLSADSSLMPGFPGARWTVFVGDSVAGTIPPQDPRLGVTPLLYGAAKGLLLTIAEPADRPGGSRAQPTDSNYLVLVGLAGGAVDTIGRLGVASQDMFGTIPASQRGQRRFYSVVDHAVIAPDAWVAVVRGYPYRVDWRPPDGQWRPGRAAIDTPIPMTDGEKSAYLERRAAATAVRGGNRQPGRASTPAPITEWPAMIPPVTAAWPPMTTYDGMVVIRRTATARASGPVYDVVNRLSIRERQIVLPADARILRFGRGSVYVAAADSDGIQRISRHPWP